MPKAEMLPNVRPVTIVLDESIHNAMKAHARKARMLLSVAYEQAAEYWLQNQSGVAKKIAKRRGFDVESET